MGCKLQALGVGQVFACRCACACAGKRTRTHAAGRAILFLKRLGPWSDGDFARRLLPVHTALLGVEEGDLEAVVARLRALDLAEDKVGY